jgi:hypothetical protein
LLALATVAIVLVRRRRDLPRRMALDVGWEIPTDGPEEEVASLDQGASGH